MNSHLRLSLIALLFTFGIISVSAETFRLKRVTSIESGCLYVFEQKGHVMYGDMSLYALLAKEIDVNDIKLTGEEVFVWNVVEKTDKQGSYGIRNVNIGSNNNYLSNKIGSENLYIRGTTDPKQFTAYWTISFQEDETAIISTDDDDKRFLGYESESSDIYKYKAYEVSELSKHPHAIAVYKLIEEDESAIAAPTFSPAGGTYSGVLDVTITCATDGASIYYTTDGTEPTKNSSLYDYSVHIEKSTTIKAIAVKGEEAVSTVATATYNIVSGGTLINAGFSFSNNKCNIDINAAEFDYPKLNYAYGYDGEIVYSSSNEDVATVDSETGKVTIAGIGKTTITAYAAETEKFSAGEASYTLTVYELEDGVFDFTKGFDYGSGKSNASGSINIDEDEKYWTSGNVILKTYGRVAWDNGECLMLYKKVLGASAQNGTCELSAPDGCVITEIKIEGTDCERLKVTNKVNGTWADNVWKGTAQTVSVAHPDEISSITITKLTVTYIPQAVIGDAQYITYYNSAYALDFSAQEGMKAYVVSEVGESVVALKEIKEVPANTPVILNAEKGEYTLKTIDSAAPVGTNYLKVSDGNVSGGDNIYALAEKNADGVNFHVVESNINIPKGKCYLDTGTEKLTSARLEFIFGPVAIEGVGAATAAKGDGVYYNLNGQRAQNPNTGIYIFGNKKVLVK